MITYIAIGGEPGTGKTNLVQKLIPLLGEGGVPLKFDLIRGTKYPNGVFLLGIYDVDNAFLGTDRLSMIALRDGRKFASAMSELPSNVNRVIVFEGDRLFQPNFFRHLQTLPNTHAKLFIIECSPEVLEQRRKRRAESGINQDERFLKGRRTKYKNIKAEFEHKIIQNNTEDDSVLTVEFLYGLVQHSLTTPI